MRFKATWIFALVVILGLGFAIFDYKNHQSQTKKEAEAKRLFQIKTDAVNGLTVKKGSSGYTLEKVDGVWQVVKPLRYLADQSAVEGLLNTILAEEGTDLGLEANADLKDFGFATPYAEIALKSAAGEKRLQIGATKTFDGKFYLKFEDGKSVFLGSMTWESYSGRSLDSIRDKEVFTAVEKATELNVRAKGKDLYQLVKQDNKWKLKSPNSPLPLDANKLDKLINDFSLTKASGFLENLDTKPSPILEFSYRADNQPVTFEIYPEHEGEFQVRRSDTGVIFKVAAFTIKKLYQPLEQLLSYSEVLKFEKDKIGRLEVSGDLQLAFTKNADKWELDKGEKATVGKEAQEDKIGSLLSALGQMKVYKQNLVSGKINRMVKLIDAKGGSLGQFEFGATTKQKDFFGQERSLVPVRFNKWNVTFGIEEVDYTDMGFKELVRESKPEPVQVKEPPTTDKHSS